MTAPRTRWRAGVVQELTYRGLITSTMDQAQYVLVVAFRIKGPLDQRALDSAVRTVGERHSVLRVRFEVDPDDSVYQVVDPTARVRLEVVSPRDPVAWAQAEAARRDPINMPPLLRMSLARVTDEEYLLVAALDHLAGDAWAMGVILREVSYEYARATGDPRPPLPKTTQFHDWADAQRAYLDSPAGIATLEYWRRSLPEHAADMNLLLPGFGTGAPGPGDGAARELKRHAPARTMETVRARAKELRVTPFIYLLASLVLTLADESTARRVTVLANVANRADPGSEGVVGSLTNAVLLHVDLTGVERFTDVLRRTRTVVMGAIAHQQPPMISVRRYVWPETFEEYESERRCYFALDGRPGRFSDLDLPGLDVSGYYIPDEIPERAGLEWWCHGDQDGLDVYTIFRHSDYSPEYIAHLSERLCALLADEPAADELARKIGSGQR